MTAKPRVLIVGGGFGGLQAAKGLASAPVEITLIDKYNHHLFQPLLYQVATAGLSPGSIAVPIRSVLASQKNVNVLLSEVTGADLENKTITFSDGETMGYDFLIIAAGARTNYFGNDQWDIHALGIKGLRDAIRVRERILLSFEEAERTNDVERRAALLTYVVIGGGPTGVEMAGAIAELGKRVLARDYRRIRPSDIRVVLVEMADRLLTPLTEKLSRDALEQLEELGVDVQLGRRVTDVVEDGVYIDGVFVRCAVVVWASGVRAVALATQLGVATDRAGRIVVDQHCAVQGHSDVFAIGDIANFTFPGETRSLPGVAPVALQQGGHVASMIRADLRRRPRWSFKYVDKGTMATIGRRRAVAMPVGLPAMSGWLAWVVWCLVHIRYLASFHNRIIVLFEWVWSYWTFGRGARLITANVAPKSEELPLVRPLSGTPSVGRGHADGSSVARANTGT